MRDLFGFANAFFLQFVAAALPLLTIGFFIRSLKTIIATGLLFLFFAFNSLGLYLFPLYSPLYLSWNYEGKLFEFIWPLVAVYFFGFIDFKNLGLQWPKRTYHIFLGVGLGTLFAISAFLLETITSENLTPKKFSIETMIFQFTMPGLGEEMVFRGFFLALLNQYISFQKKLSNLYLGWAVIIVSILFVSSHVIYYSPFQQSIILSGDLKNILQLSIMALMLGFLRVNTNSILPCMLCHNFSNGVYYLIT